MFAATETVYFVNAQDWPGTITAHAWDGSATGTEWPGLATVKEADQIGGKDVYSFTAEAGAYAKVIFNNGSAQTANLDWTAGKYYCKDGWYTKEEAEAKLAAPAEYESVYFVDNQGWGKANIYTWTPEVGTWPGVAMTKEAEQLAGYDVYSYTVEKGTSFGGVIFNNGSSQTANLVWTAGKYYVKDGWYTKEEAIEKLSAPVTPPVITYVLMGVAGDWTTGIALTANPDNANEYVLLDQTISEGDAVKVVTLTDGVATAWCGNVDEYSVEHSADDMGNIVLAPGKYDFYYKVAEDLIYIGAVAPELPTYDVTVADATVSTMGQNIVLSGNWEEKLLTVSLWQGGATQGFGTYAAEDYAPIFLGTAELTPTSEGVYADNGDNTFTFTATANDAEGGIYNISVTGAIPAAEIEWISMPLEISNLTTMEMPVGDVTYLQLMGRNDMEDADVMLFLNNYTGEEKAYEVNAESSLVTYGGLELTVMDGSITKSVDPEKGDVFAGTVHAFVVDEEVGEMYVEFALTMYALPSIAIELEDVEIVVNEESAIAFFNATWEGSPLQVEVSGFEKVEFKEYEECWLSIGDDVNWVDAAAGPAAIIIEDGVAMLEGEFTSFATGKTYEVMLTGTLPVEEPEVVEPTYTENKLNTYAFGLESELNDTALVVTYRLNNSNATSVNVLVYKGEEVVATVAGTTTIGVNTVVIPVATLPQGRMLTWSVEVNGTSVEAPTQEAKTYDFYHPSGVDIDNNPENPTFGMLLVNEGMQKVKGVDGYVSTGFGAGIFAFTPSLDLIPNGDLPGYNGGVEFNTYLPEEYKTSDGGRYTAYSPRRVRISDDGRIFVTSLDVNGTYLWELNPENLNEWTPVFQGTLTDNKELITADSNFVAAPNNGFDVKGAGENLQLMMYSVNVQGITSAAMGGFRCDEYNLGTATSWATAPSKNWVLGKYAINYLGTQVVYDNEGGIWIASYRGAANDANPGLVHINADGVEDAKLVWSNVRQAGIRFNNDFTKLVVAGNNGAAKKATIYAVSKDANGAPVLTEETVIDMAVLGNNLNDFVFDYAGNLYAVSNSNEKLVAWAMPYSGVVETPAASKYAFHIGELLPDPVVVTEMVGVVKRAVQNGDAVIVLTHEADGTAHIYEVANGTILELLQNGVVPVDPENKGSYLAISDIAVTEDGKLVANNYVRCQFAGTAPEDGYKLGTSYYYIWDDLTGAPRVWFTSQATARSSHGDMGKTFAVKGTSTDAKVLVTAVHNNNRAVRMALYSIIDGVYEEPDIAGGTYNNDYYFNFGLHTTANYYKEATQGKEFYLLASPLADASWIIEGELSEPSEFLVPAEVGADYAANQEIAAGTLGNKYQGTSIVTVGEQVLMVAPYATAEGLLAGVKVLDITAGLDATEEVAVADLDAAVEATAAATAVAVAENTLTITLVADATLHTLEVVLEEKPNYMLIEDKITNLEIDLANMAIIGGPSTMWQVEVFLGLGQDNGDGTITLTEESSVAIMGFDARFIDGYAYDIDVTAPAAKAVLHVEDSGFFYEIKLDMTSAAPADPIVVVVEDATVQIDTIPLFGDAVDYALKMTANWTDTTDNTTYPVLVEVPVYYPEATEPFEMTCTVTIGGEGDDDPWLGFGEGPLTITTVDGVVTAKGIIANPYTGVAFDVTVSGKLPNMEMGIDNININAKPVKMIKNGMLIINKGGREFNAQGAMIK